MSRRRPAGPASRIRTRSPTGCGAKRRSPGCARPRSAAVTPGGASVSTPTGAPVAGSTARQMGTNATPSRSRRPDNDRVEAAQRPVARARPAGPDGGRTRPGHHRDERQAATRPRARIRGIHPDQEEDRRARRGSATASAAARDQQARRPRTPNARRRCPGSAPTTSPPSPIRCVTPAGRDSPRRRSRPPGRMA